MGAPATGLIINKTNTRLSAWVWRGHDPTYNYGYRISEMD